MQSVMSRSALGRRVAATAVLGLAATTLGLGLAGSATAVTTTDLQGTVTGVNGAPVKNVRVSVYDATQNPYDVSPIDTTLTDTNGHYLFDSLDFDGLGVSKVRVQFDDQDTFDQTTSTYYVTRWNGGSRYWSGAAAVPVSTDGDTTVNASLPRAAILAGTLVAQDGHTLDDFGIDLVNSEDGWGNWVTSNFTATAFRIAAEPGTLRLGGYGWDKGPDGAWSTVDDLYYVETWWRSGDVMSQATPITVASGQTVSGLNLRVTNALTARKAPSVAGFAAVGRTLTASPGTWSRNEGTEFSYTWMRGATVVGTGASYAPTAADLNQRLTVVVRALNGTNAGQAASAQTDPVRYAADAKGKAKALGHRQVRFAVKLVSAKQKPVKGKVVVLRGNKVVHKAVKLVKGKAVVVVKHQPKGKQAFSVLYKGNKVLAKSAKDFTVRVR